MGKKLNLDIRTIHFSLTAIASILHRISGVIMFLLVGFLLRTLDISLSSPEGFKKISSIMTTFFMKVIIWSIFTILVYHITGGVRHMLIDFGFYKNTLKTGRNSVLLFSIITIVLSLLFGIFLW